MVLVGPELRLDFGPPATVRCTLIAGRVDLADSYGDTSVLIEDAAP